MFSTGIALPGAQKKGPGRIGLDATVGDVRVRTGDIVVGDRDGVVVIAADSLDAVRAAGEARAAKETTTSTNSAPATPRSTSSTSTPPRSSAIPVHSHTELCGYALDFEAGQVMVSVRRMSLTTGTVRTRRANDPNTT